MTVRLHRGEWNDETRATRRMSVEFIYHETMNKTVKREQRAESPAPVWCPLTVNGTKKRE